MHTLCLTSNLTSTELAAWVQAIGSILAIIGSVFVAMWQSNKQYKNSSKLINFDKRISQLLTTFTISGLSKNSLKSINAYIDSLSNTDAFLNIATGKSPSYLSELRFNVNSLNSIPLHTLPYQIINLTTIVIACNREFLELLESSLKNYRFLNAENIETFLKTQKEIRDKLDATCKDIDQHIYNSKY